MTKPSDDPDWMAKRAAYLEARAKVEKLRPDWPFLQGSPLTEEQRDAILEWHRCEQEWLRASQQLSQVVRLPGHDRAGLEGDERCP